MGGPLDRDPFRPLPSRPTSVTRDMSLTPDHPSTTATTRALALADT
jgi:hypothetical protein